MKTSEFKYELPEELIAQTPIKDRSSSNMMVLNKKTGEIQHKTFENILDYLNTGDCLVLNDTRVIPARIFGKIYFKDGSYKDVEIFLLKRLNQNNWEALVRPGKKFKIGTEVYINEELKGKVVDILEDGNRIIEFNYLGIWEEVLDRAGNVPLPPYIKETLEDKERYQTVYNKYSGSAAAPTAGLHFTKELLKKIEAKGVNIVYLTLHVGLGTFRPVKVENVLEHKMHSEEYHISKESCDIINSCKNNGKRVISVGTTSCRVLESATDNRGIINPLSGETDIFIYPGYKFKIVDALITNFHLPESTLLMLVSALSSKDIILNAYKEAVKQRYRFFSFGDCMYIF